MKTHSLLQTLWQQGRVAKFADHISQFSYGFITALLALWLICGSPASAGTVTYTANDALNTSSFAGGLGATNWDSGQPPAAGNDYIVASGRTLRTPTNGAPAAAYTFAGDSLTLGAGSAGAGSFLMKGSNVITIANLILTNANVSNGDPGGTPKITRIAGGMNIQTNANLRPTETNRTLVVTAALSGSGNLSVWDRGIVTLSGAHSFNGPLTLFSTVLDMDGTVAIRPSALIIGKDSATVSGQTNFYGIATNIVRAGGALNVGYGPAGDLRVGWRTSSNITNNPTGVLDVSAQNSFDANVGNLIIGYSAVASAGTSASALGLVYLATNNSIVATNIVMGDTIEGTHPSQHQLILGSGSNYIDSPIMVVGARKQRVLLQLPTGGKLVLTNSATGRCDLTVAGNNTGTSGNPSDLMNLTGGPFIASLGNLIVGQKTGGNVGGATGTLTTATNSGTAIDVNDLTLGTMAGDSSGATLAASGTLNFNGGTLKVNNNLSLGLLDLAGYGTAVGILNLNAGTISVAGDLVNGAGTSTLNVNGGALDLLPAGDSTPGNVTVNTLTVNGIITNAGAIQVFSALLGAGSIVNQTGATTVYGTLDPGTATSAGTLKLGALTLNSTAILRMNLTNNTTVGNGVNDLLDITGDVDLGNASLSIAQLTSGLAVGTYRLANYTGELINTLTLPNVGRYTLSLVTDTSTSPKHLNLIVSGNPFSLRWVGDQGTPWDITGTPNWVNQLSSQDFYYDNDTVLFNDLSSNPNVTLDVPALPGNVVFSNNVNAYSLTGAGKISGVTGLTKQGTGSLSLATSNDFTGPVTISAGLVVAGNSGALGATNSGTTIASGGTLDVNDKTFSTEIFHVQGAGYDGNGAIINTDLLNPLGARTATRFVYLDGDTTFGGYSRWDIRGTSAAASGILSGTNYTLTKVGTNGVYFTDGTDVNVSNIVVKEGSVVIESASTINTNAIITLSNNTALSFYHLSTPMGRSVFVGDGARIRATDAGATSQNQVSGKLTLNGSVAYVETTGNSTNILHLQGQVTGPAQLIKVGNMMAQVLSSANNWSGGTTISNGILSVGDGIVNGSLPATPPYITNYATLMYNVATNTTVTPSQQITGPGGIRKLGDGILALTVSNSFTGPVATGDGTPLSGGVIRLLNRYGFGDPSISKTVSVIRAEIWLEGGMTPPDNLYFLTSAQTNAGGAGSGLVAFRNVAGTNNIPNTVEVYSGAGSCEYASDAGRLIFDGPIYLGNSSSRSAIFSGAAGEGIVNGQLSNQSTNNLTVEKRGSSTWTLTAANVYTGPTLVTAGTLVIKGSISGSGVTVSGGTLSGAGTINAPVTVQLAGTLAPGSSPGTLTINNNLTLQGTTVMEVSRNGSVLTNDQVAGVVSCNYGGTLVVANTGSSSLQPGDSFQLFAASSRNGSFTNIIYPSGYNWTNSLSADGRVGVQSVAAPTSAPNFPPGGITALPSGGVSLTVTGAVGTPYRLWASTNVAATPIPSTWTLLNSGTISTSPFTINDPNATNYLKRFYLFSTP